MNANTISIVSIILFGQTNARTELTVNIYAHTIVRVCTEHTRAALIRLCQFVYANKYLPYRPYKCSTYIHTTCTYRYTHDMEKCCVRMGPGPVSERKAAGVSIYLYFSILIAIFPGYETSEITCTNSRGRAHTHFISFRSFNDSMRFYFPSLRYYIRSVIVHNVAHTAPTAAGISYAFLMTTVRYYG